MPYHTLYCTLLLYTLTHTVMYTVYVPKRSSGQLWLRSAAALCVPFYIYRIRKRKKYLTKQHNKWKNREEMLKKNPAYGRHRISRPMLIDAPIQREAYKATV